ncbi:IclR family transcriptional regulator domain-containing protein [Streptomyces griseoruber]|uniref:IclR-ED domain-containing protein n=1 Tax=Streptomyces griseoruber TaxID=1943 RepID=A0A101SVZ8_9ACTN|nr:IclR family transcriptional regulator C-terminal domain-containing protein [Streptomyces griseoruber]KUN81215.1 hypothetical protein AQJ64_22645 [Streptomyces griseoruber]
MLQQCLAKVRREGCAAVQGALTTDTGRAFAVPVRDSRGAVVAAVGVAGPPDVARPRRVAPMYVPPPR